MVDMSEFDWFCCKLILVYKKSLFHLFKYEHFTKQYSVKGTRINGILVHAFYSDVCLILALLYLIK